MKKFKMRKRKRPAKDGDDAESDTSRLSIGDQVSICFTIERILNIMAILVNLRSLPYRLLSPYGESQFCQSKAGEGEEDGCSGGFASWHQSATHSDEAIPLDAWKGNNRFEASYLVLFCFLSCVRRIGSLKVPISEEDIDLSMQLVVKETMKASSSSVEASPMALLHAAASYYQFPLIYGVSIYPRRQGLKRSSQNGQVSLQAFGPNFIKTINEEW